MIPLQRIRDDAELIRQGARRKRMEAPVDEILEVDAQARRLRTEVEALRAEQRRASSRLHGAPTDEERQVLAAIRERIQQGELRLGELDERVAALLLVVPNPPHASVPDGAGPDDNPVLRQYGEPPTFDFTPLPHYELGEALGWFDFERAAKVSGSRFAFVRGQGARLQRALISFFLDVATGDHGYAEVAAPYLVRRDAMVGTAQLPKFEEDAYRTDDDLFLIPTAEVPVTNLYRDEILDGEALPIAHVAHTPCWRREAGAAGRDTRGYIRMHQFDKVEMVRFCAPEDSDSELELLTSHATSLLEQLGLCHRVVVLCSGDTGFAQSRTNDVEAWAPGLQRWLEVSSCSVYGDFQARRAGIRFRRTPSSKPEYVHTLNGSGLAVPRTLAALMESYQQAGGSIVVPEVLRPYMGGQERVAAS
ncbi:MAG: serine--tRNA ligase [Candidatus Dormibacteria bacterium]